MATSNQIELAKLEETRRSNRAREQQAVNELEENRRHNRRSEKSAAWKNVVSAIPKFKGGKNDFSWYSEDPQLLKDVANLSFGAPLGSNMGKFVYTGSNYKAPGIMKIGYVPIIGKAGESSKSDPINIAAKNIYAYVRYANSGSRNYEAVDLMMYILSVATASALLEHMKLVYSVAKDAKGENWYFGTKMLEALCGTGNDIVEHLPQFRMLINRFAVNLNAFYVPGNLPFFKRQSWLPANIFKDHAVKKSQVYVFKPECYYIIDNLAKSLVARAMPDGSNTYEAYTRCVDQILSNLQSNEDSGIMSGDILKAYGDTGLWYFNEIDEDYHVEASYSQEVLTQINGATLVGYPDDEDIQNCWFDVIQKDGVIMNGKVSYVNHSILGTGLKVTGVVDLMTKTPGIQVNHNLVNMYKDDVKPEDVMVATRLMATRTVADDGETIEIQTCGTELCLYAKLYGCATDGKDYTSTLIYDGMLFDFASRGAAEASTTINTYLAILRDWNKFDWAPYIRVSAAVLNRYNTSNSATTVGPTFYAVYDSMDFANYAVISESELQAMNGVAALSLFSIPMLGKKVRTR